jgi:hypothetical protein
MRGTLALKAGKDTKMANLLEFMQAYLGKPSTGTNAANSGQCVGLIEVWAAANKKTWIGGNARDLLVNAKIPDYRVIWNTPTNYPKAGDIVVWGPSWGAGYGHTAIVVAATSMYLVTFEQNDPTGSPPIVSTHNYSGVQGWLSW